MRRVAPIAVLRLLAWDELDLYEREALGAWYRRYYLTSKRWQAKRAEFIAAAGGCCERCGVRGTSNRTPASVLHVHHLNYDAIGEESAGDVEVLCSSCHRQETEVEGRWRVK